MDSGLEQVLSGADVLQYTDEEFALELKRIEERVDALTQMTANLKIDGREESLNNALSVAHERKSESTTIDDVPEEILCLIFEPLGLKDRISVSRCSHAFRTALSNSKWTLSENVNGDLTVARTSESEVTERYTICFHSVKPLHKRIFGPFVPVDAIGYEEFPALRRLFGKLHLGKLTLQNIDLDSLVLQHFNDFIKGCTFDTLSITINTPNLLNERMQHLMRRARKAVEIKMVELILNEDQLLAIECPVEFIIDRNVPAPLDAELFIKLLAKGHSLRGFSVPLPSVDDIKSAIEMVSSASRSQFIDIIGLDFSMCKQLARNVNARLVERPQLPRITYMPGNLPTDREIVLDAFYNGDYYLSYQTAPVGAEPTQIFAHLGGYICLYRKLGEARGTRLIVNSEYARDFVIAREHFVKMPTV